MITIDLPFPVSTNALTFNRKGGRTKTKKYQAWIREAGWELIRQNPGHMPGEVVLNLKVERKKDNRRRDLSNHIKGIEDLLVAYDVIEDDSKVVCLMAEWSETVTGARVEITEW